MKKLLIASAISAIFAAPATVLAQAAAPAAGPAAPTLDKVLEASGISVSGYIDTAYSRANRQIETLPTGAVSTRVFDSQNNSFALHQFGLSVAKQPKEGFGGLVNLTVGKDAQVIHSFPEVTPTTTVSGTSMFDVTQAFMQYATGPLTIIAGKFVTLQGTEVIWSPSNPNFSHSILFGAIPFTHTGVRGTWVLNDQVSLIFGLNNGWDQLTDSNRAKTFEFGASLNPIKPLTITASAYSGKETVPQATPGSPDGTRNSFNVVASYTIIDPLSVGVEYLSVTQENVPSGATTIKAKYSGVAGYVTYMFMPKWRGVLRLESFDDHDGFHFATVNPTTLTALGVKYKEATATVSYLAADNFELRGEARRDTADKTVFANFGTTAPGAKSLLSYAIQGLYKF